MEQPEITITLDNIPEDDWIKLNYSSIGLYRVKYESNTLANLNQPISTKLLSPQDRLMIQNDVAALCNAGHQSFVDFLKLLPSYKDEDNFTVWKSIGKKKKKRIFKKEIFLIFLVSNIGDLSSLLEYTDYFDEFKKYCLNIFSSIQKKLGWDPKENEDALSAMLRPMILNIVGKSGDQDIINEGQKSFERHLQGDLMNPNIRGAVYVIVSRYGDETTQEQLRKVN